MKRAIGRLVLIEGLPGSGKTPTARLLHAALSARGVPCEVYYEASKGHPIAIGDIRDIGAAIKGFSEGRNVKEWKALALSVARSRRTTIVESRLIQNAGMFLLLNGRSADDAVRHTNEIARALRGANPFLIYLQVCDPVAHMDQVLREEPAEWVERVTAAWTTTQWVKQRGLSGREGFVEFFREWGPLLDEIIAGLDIETAEVEDPRARWRQAIPSLVERLV